MTRYLIMVMIFLLYFIPFYQNNFSFSENFPLDKKTVFNDLRLLPLDESPYYAEDFVNNEETGTMCHVSSITPADDNKMACTWYAGSREGAEDVAIYFSVFNEEKGFWTKPVILTDRNKSSSELNRYVKKVGNPLIFTDKNGRLWLFYVSIVAGGWSVSSLNYKISSDGGLTWSKSNRMILSPFLNLTNNVKNKGIAFDDGSFVIPVYQEFIKKFSQLVRVYPKDGVHYEILKMTGENNAIQPSLLYDGQKKLIAFFRNKSSAEKKYILTAYSNDLGQSWSKSTDTSLPNPDSGFDMINMSDGSYLGVINNSFRERDNLILVISHDKGTTWKTLKVLENTPGKKYAYPSINRSRRGFYHITYSYELKRIKHIVFNEAWIKKNENSIH